MFQIAHGVTIPFPEKIKEEFQVFEKSILLNLSFEKLEALVVEFFEQLEEPLLFVLELPLTQQEEAGLRKDDTCPFHKKVCYLYEQSKEQVRVIMHRHGALLLNDGLSQFAIYSHVTKDGIYIQKYKVISIFSDMPEEYIELLKKYGLTQTDKLLTVWDTFSYETPGRAEKVELNGTDIFGVYDELEKAGMYVAKIVPD